MNAFKCNSTTMRSTAFCALLVVPVFALPLSLESKIILSLLALAAAAMAYFSSLVWQLDRYSTVTEAEQDEYRQMDDRQRVEELRKRLDKELADLEKSVSRQIKDLTINGQWLT